MRDILYPVTRENLRLNLETIANPKDIYDDSILGAPTLDDEFRDYVLVLVADDAPQEPRLGPRLARELPDVTGKARVMAEQWVLMARSETFEKLGEHPEAEALASRLIRELPIVTQ